MASTDPSPSAPTLPDHPHQPALLSERLLQARLAAVVETTDDAIITKNLNGIIQTWNPGATRIFGYAPEEVIGKPVLVLIPPERHGEEDMILGRLRKGERIEHYETVRQRKDRNLIDVSLSVAPIKDETGRVVAASKIARDVTMRKQTELALRNSEARLRAIVEATPECVKIVSPEGQLLFMNRGGLALVEASEFQAVESSCVYDLVAPEHRHQWVGNHARVCAGEKLTWEFEIIGLQGARRWMETSAVPLVLEDGRTAQLAVTRDVTSRKQMDAHREMLLESERAARAEAERVSLSKDEFLATLSHELRTPLNAILGWAQVLRSRKFADPDLQEGLEVIERNTRVQTQLIEELLDMSRIISGKVRLDVKDIEIHDAIKAAVESIRPTAEARGVRLQMVLDSFAGPVRGDFGRLQQCFWNLLTNAIKFTPRGGRVQITLERVNSHLEISVMDSGQGIAPEFLPHVFERFRQADQTTTRKHGGLGLGLAIVKQLVELHGGRVRARSPGLGQGATFSIELPVVIMRSQASAAQQTSLEQTLSAVDCPSLKGYVVLAVDDEADSRGLVRRVLEECGAKVVLASSAAEGLELLRQEHPHIILSDIGMPSVDGYQFIQQVRSLPPEQGGRTPAVAITAFARPQDRTKALLAGFQTHVPKPVEPTELAAIVASLATPP